MLTGLKKVLVEKGLVHLQDIQYPAICNGHQFTEFHYVHKLPNGEALDHTWLVYSISNHYPFASVAKSFLIQNQMHLFSVDIVFGNMHPSVLSEHETSKCTCSTGLRCKKD